MSEADRGAQSGWVVPPQWPALAADQVHLWLVRLPSGATQQATDADWLDPQERARLSRLRFDRDRVRFAAAHAALRAILAGYLDIHPAALRFAHNAHGKPALTGAAAGLLRFNLSHSATLALCVISRSREVGVDIERIDPQVAGLALAQTFFSGQEQADLLALRGAAQTQGFYDCWTRKEAYLKARGCGLSLPLSSFAVSVTPSTAPQLLIVPGTGALTLLSVPVRADYCAAVAAEGAAWQLHTFLWSRALLSQAALV